MHVLSETFDQLRRPVAGGLAERDVVIAFRCYLIEPLTNMHASAGLFPQTSEARDVALHELERFALEPERNMDAASADVARVFEALFA